MKKGEARGQHVPSKHPSPLRARCRRRPGQEARRSGEGRAVFPGGGRRRRRRRSLRRRPGARSENVSVPLLLLPRLPLCRAALSREGPSPPPRSMGSRWLRLAALLALGACPGLAYEGREGKKGKKEGGRGVGGAPRGGAAAGDAGEKGRARRRSRLLPPGRGALPARGPPRGGVGGGGGGEGVAAQWPRQPGGATGGGVGVVGVWFGARSQPGALCLVLRLVLPLARPGPAAG